MIQNLGVNYFWGFCHFKIFISLQWFLVKYPSHLWVFPGLQLNTTVAFSVHCAAGKAGSAETPRAELKLNTQQRLGDACWGTPCNWGRGLLTFWYWAPAASPSAARSSASVTAVSSVPVTSLFTALGISLVSRFAKGLAGFAGAVLLFHCGFLEASAPLFSLSTEVLSDLPVRVFELDWKE